MIEEKYIENYLEQIENDSLGDRFINQTDFVDYLNSDVFTSLNAEEKKMLFFCCEVIFNAAFLAKGELEINFDVFFDAEEKNWSIREEFSNWSDTADAFFTNYKEEDLLAFVEDLLSDEEGSISEIAKEIIFITSKSLIESLQFNSN